MNEMDPAVLLQPFLNVIRSDFTTGPVTSLALTSVTKFLNYGFLSVHVDSGSNAATSASRQAAVSAAMENVVNSATHARLVFAFFVRQNYKNFSITSGKSKIQIFKS